MGLKRLDKLIALNCNVSRKDARKLIKDGAVSVNSRVCLRAEELVDADIDDISVKGYNFTAKEHVYIMLNKPAGFVTTMSDEQGRKTITDLLDGIEERVYPIGRLDRNSEGLILLTNDGAFANMVMHPSGNIQKTYRVTVSGKVSEEQIIKLSTGLDIDSDGRLTLPCDVFVIERKEDRTVLNFIIHEGRNRQIRRMCEMVGLEVLRLKRTEIAGVKLGMLSQGKWRNLNEKELKRLTNISQSKKNQ